MLGANSKLYIKKGIFYFIFFIAVLSVSAVFYRYMTMKDFSYESKPIDAFTEEDL